MSTGRPFIDDGAVRKDEPGNIDALTEKLSPVGADVILLEDSADSFNQKKALISNLPAGAPAVHALGGAQHSASTLAALNALVSDATLIDTNDARLSDARTPTTHGLAGAEHSASTLAALNALVSDATLIDTNDARLSDARTPTAHNLAGAEHGADTLANLNSKISDATLIDTNDARLSNARTPTSHAFAGAEHSVSTLAQVNSKISDATLIDTNDARLSDARTPTVHNLAGAEHGADTLANLNAKITDATLIDTNDARLSDARTPTAHAFAGAEHSASTLAAVNSKITDATLIDTNDARLSDARTPTAHAFAGAEHSASTLAAVNSKISDATLIDTNDARLSDARTPTAHAASHESLGSDAIAHQNLSGAGTNTHAQIDSHISSTSNPHSVTKAQVGLTNVTDDAQLKRAANDISTFTEKLTPVSADLLLIEDSEAAGVKKKVQVGNLPGGGGGGTFGSQFHQNESNAQSTTTDLVTYTTKATFTTGSLPAGNYLLSFYCEATNDVKDRGAELVIDDGATTFASINQISKLAGVFYDDFGGFQYLTGISGVKTFNLKFRCYAGGTAYVRNARLHFYRVS